MLHTRGLEALPHSANELAYLLKRYAKDSELLSAPFALAKRRSELFPFVGTDLVVEGFPRSANTYVLHALKWSNPEFKYASHLHACGPIRHAAKKNMPMLVLIREPRSAVVSLAIRENIRLDYCFYWYLKFYKCVEQHRRSLVLADFATVTRELEPLYKELRRTFGLQLRQAPKELSELAEVKKMVVYSHRRTFRGTVDPLRVGVPTEEKRNAVPEFERQIGQSQRLSELLKVCNHLYERLAPDL